MTVTWYKTYVSEHQDYSAIVALAMHVSQRAPSGYTRSSHSYPLP